jgi:hypothetical protein
MATDDVPARIDDRPDVEMRYECPRWIVDIIDAHAKAGINRKSSRNKVAIAALEAWAIDQIHLASLVARMSRGNGNVPPSEWGDLGD